MILLCILYSLLFAGVAQFTAKEPDRTDQQRMQSFIESTTETMFVFHVFFRPFSDFWSLSVSQNLDPSLRTAFPSFVSLCIFP